MVIPVSDTLRRQRNRKYCSALLCKVDKMELEEVRDYVARVEGFYQQPLLVRLWENFIGIAPGDELYIFARSRLEREDNLFL